MGRAKYPPAPEWVEVRPKKLIAAVVECVDDDGQPPAELELSWQCERWHALPDVGALLDQDARRMYVMAALSNIYNALSHMRNCEGAQIHSLTNSERSILRMLIDLKLIFNG